VSQQQKQGQTLLPNAYSVTKKRYKYIKKCKLILNVLNSGSYEYIVLPPIIILY